FGSAMLTIVTSTNATAAPSDAIASTVRGDGPRRRAGATALMSRSAAGDGSTGTAVLDIARASLLGRQTAWQVGVGSERLPRRATSDLDRERERLPVHQPDVVDRWSDDHGGV